jgi:hypothetical protein
VDIISPNLEQELLLSEHITQKCQNSKSYSQNLYAAMCNRDFQRNNTWPILTDQKWSCSWRHAGGIVADMRGSGDYIDWYCSGIGNDDAGYGLDARPATGYVPEGKVTEEIELDLNQLGWRPVSTEPTMDD